jgi:prepilin-type N-terminal cleavage/methylation domain-containing protein
MKEKSNSYFQKFKENKGFTTIELVIVIGIISILSQIAFDLYADYKAKAYNAAAINDGRNLVSVVVNNLVSYDDVDYTHDENDDNRIGGFDTDGNTRSPVLILSKGVRARIVGENDTTGNGYMEAYLYSMGGIKDLSTPSGRREYYCIVDESTGESYFSLD